MQSTPQPQSAQNRVFGFPLRGFSLFQGLLLSVSAALLTFCIVTMISIFVLLAMKLHGHPNLDMAISYRDIGFPAGIVVLAIALPSFAVVWLRGKLQK